MSKNSHYQNGPATVRIEEGTMNKWNLRSISLITYGLIGMSIWCNMTFYSTFGSGSSSVVYALIGLLLDLAKMALIGFIVYFIREIDRYLTEAALCVGLWLVLSLLSLAAAYGFLSQINEQYEAERLNTSVIYTQHQAAVDNAQAQLDQLAQYASLDTVAITAKIGSLTAANQTLLNSQSNNSIGQRTGRTVGQMTVHCTENNWYSGHYCGEFINNKASIQQLQARLDGHDRYQSVHAHHQMAQQSFRELTVTGAAAANQAHPLFFNVGQFTSNPAASVKRGFIFLTSLIFELLASALMFMRFRVTSGSTWVHSSQAVTPISAQIDALSIASNDTISLLLEQVRNDIATGRLKSLSFRTIQRTYRVGPPTAKLIRQAMLREGIAYMDKNTHQITLNRVEIFESNVDDTGSSHSTSVTSI